MNHPSNTLFHISLRNGCKNRHIETPLHLVDASVPWGGGESFLFELLEPVKAPILGVLTKIDLVKPKEALLPLIQDYNERRPGAVVLPISAPKGDGHQCSEPFVPAFAALR